jgi:tRNA A-37 threonylcarbamoyl transferase component Bud32
MIGEAFHAIHSLGVCHGDIRVENILVAKDGKTAWVIDFEFAEIITSANDLDHPRILLESRFVADLLRDIKHPTQTDPMGRNGMDAPLYHGDTGVAL